MLPTRSARLAATLLLALLLGWVVRAQRLRHTDSGAAARPPGAGTPADPSGKSSKNSFPDE